MLPKSIDLTDFSASECSDMGLMSELCYVCWANVRGPFKSRHGHNWSPHVYSRILLKHPDIQGSNKELHILHTCLARVLYTHHHVNVRK